MPDFEFSAHTKEMLSESVNARGVCCGLWSMQMCSPIVS